jgi:hypothetical protein
MGESIQVPFNSQYILVIDGIPYYLGRGVEVYLHSIDIVGRTR